MAVSGVGILAEEEGASVANLLAAGLQGPADKAPPRSSGAA